MRVAFGRHGDTLPHRRDRCHFRSGTPETAARTYLATVVVVLLAIPDIVPMIVVVEPDAAMVVVVEATVVVGTVPVIGV